MTSLTTMFIVGKDEYVEFNETMGLKAFLEHIWDQSQTPLQSRDVSAGHLHSTGARISSTPPPKIEFPTVFRVKGKGNTYRSSGRYISWDELARLNPLAVKAPPSLDEFKARGGQVGSGPRLKPRELLRRDEPMAKVRKQASLAASSFSEKDGWIGGASESIYATAKPAMSPPTSDGKAKDGGGAGGTPQPQQQPTMPATPERKTEQQPSSATKSKSLLERLGIEDLTTPPPKAVGSSPLRTTPSPGIRRPGAKIPSPLPLTSPARVNGPLSPGGARTPLSASHPPPETPLKMSHRGGPQTPATPHHPLYAYAGMTEKDAAARASGLGLGLTPHKPTIPFAHLGSPEGRNGLLHDPATGSYPQSSNDGSPSYAMKPGAGSAAAAPAASSSTASTAGSQIEAMLERLRRTRTGLGTEASMWAPKASSSATATAGPKSSSQSSSAPKKGRSGVSGVAAASDKLSTAMGSGSSAAAGRRKPGHRHNGLQLSLGQGIEVMQNLDEKAEDEMLGSEERQDDAAVDGWLGNVVPPTPALGADSPQFESGVNGHGNGSSGFWGSTVASSPEAPRASLLPTRPPASSKSTEGGMLGLQEVWSGDDDDEAPLFGQSAAKEAPKSSRNDRSPSLTATKAPRAPPPSLSYRHNKTPSPSHLQLDAGSGQDTTRLSLSVSALAAPKPGESSRSPSLRLSPSSMPSPLDDSDGDADVEDDKDQASHASRKPRSSPRCSRPQRRNDTSPIHAGATAESGRPKKGKRDPAERKWGRQSSQNDNVKPQDVIDGASRDQKHSEFRPLEAPASPALPSVTEGAKKATQEAKLELAEVAFRPAAAAEEQAQHGATTSSPEGNSDEASLRSLPPVANEPVSTEPHKDAVAAGSNDAVTPTEHIRVGQDDTAATASADPATESSPEHHDDTKTDTSTNQSEPARPSAAADPSEEPTAAASSETESTASKAFPRSESGFNWAEDDDEIDDALPDLEDWGITIPATPRSKSDSSFAAPTTAAASPLPAATTKPDERPQQQQRPRAERNSEPVWKRADRVVPGKNGRKAQEEPPKGPLGIRITGRAAAAAATEKQDAALTPRRKLLDGTKFSMHAQSARAAEAAPPPPIVVATPYGRWKANNGVAAPAAAAASATKGHLAVAEEERMSVKGSGRRHAPPVSPTASTSSSHHAPTGSGKASTTSTDSASRRDRPAVRPRVAADSGAFARLVGGTVNSAAASSPANSATPNHHHRNGAAAAAKSAGPPSSKKDLGAAGSMHAPRALPPHLADASITSASAPVASPIAKVFVRLPSGSQPNGRTASVSASANASEAAEAPRLPNGFEHNSGRRRPGGNRSGSGAGGGASEGRGAKKRR